MLILCAHHEQELSIRVFRVQFCRDQLVNLHDGVKVLWLSDSIFITHKGWELPDKISPFSVFKEHVRMHMYANFF